MLVVALSWEVDWASIGSRRLLRTEDRLLFQVKEGRESRSKRREGRGAGGGAGEVGEVGEEE